MNRIAAFLARHADTFENPQSPLAREVAESVLAVCPALAVEPVEPKPRVTSPWVRRALDRDLSHKSFDRFAPEVAS